MFRLTPLNERIERFLIAYPFAKKIPLHPNDYWTLRFEGRLKSFPLPVTCLGMFTNPDESDAADVAIGKENSEELKPVVWEVV